MKHNGTRAGITATIFLFVSAAALLPVMLCAQGGVLRGTVTDAGGKPLAGATVRVKNAVQGTATGLNGAYEIRKIKPGPHTIIFTMIGHHKTEKDVVIARDSTSIADAVLVETPIETDEVVVTAGRRAQSFEEVPVSISVFSSRDIESRSLTSIDQALRSIPGVNMTESQVNIRGSSGYSRALGTRVLLLLDGIPLLSGDAGEIKFDAVPMFMVDRIEVVKGAGSALYGSSALGGVINVITKSPGGPVTRVRAYSGFYDNPTYEQWKWWGDSPRRFNGIDAQFGNSADGLSWLLSAGARNNQGYRNHDDFAKWNVNARGQYRIGPDRNLSAALNFAYDDRANWIYWRDLQNALTPPLDTDLSERILSTKLQGTAQYRTTVSPVFAHSVRTSIYRTSFIAYSDTADYSTHPTDRTQSTANVLGLEWQGNLSLGERNMLTTGVDASATSVESETFGDRSGFSAALYAQNEYHPYEHLTLSLGARADLTKADTLATDGSVNPRLGAAWTPIPGTILRASHGWGFRAPSVAERFSTASGGGLLTKPNPSLLSERSRSWELGVRQELPLPAVLDLAVFHNDYENLIEPVLDPVDGKIVFRNITRARIQGFEVGIQAALLDGALTASAGYTYMYPRDLTADALMKYRPKHILTTSGEVRILDGFIAGDFRFVGRIEEIDRELGIIVSDAGKRVAAYVTDLRAGWDFSPIRVPVSAKFIVSNVFQYNYAEIVGNVAPIRNYMLVLEWML